MDLRGRFIGPNPVFENQAICSLQDSSTRVLVNTLKSSYEKYYNNTFSALDNTIDLKVLAMYFLDNLICYIRGVGKNQSRNKMESVLPHFITNPILNSLLEQDTVSDDLIYVFCIQANVNFTELTISPKVHRNPIIFETLKQFNLQFLNLSNCMFVDDEVLYNLTNSKTLQNSLISLNLSGCKNIKILPQLSPLKALELLDISEIYQLNLMLHPNVSLLDKICLILSQLPLLRKLWCYSNGLLNRLNNINDFPYGNKWAENIILNSKLESLDIGLRSQLWFEQLYSSNLENFLKYLTMLPNLDYLDLTGWSITSQTFFNVFSSRKPFKFLGLLNTSIHASIDSTTIHLSVSDHAEEVTSLATIEQVLNCLNAYENRAQEIQLILSEIKHWLKNKNLDLNTESLPYFTEAILRILNRYQPVATWEEKPMLPIFCLCISCLSLITSQFGEELTVGLKHKIMKHCMIQYQHIVANRYCLSTVEELVELITALITPDILGNEEWFPFYTVILKFVLNLICQERFNAFVNPYYFISRLLRQHSQLLTMFTVELSRRNQVMIGIEHDTLSVLCQEIYRTPIFRTQLYPIANTNVSRMENLWETLRNLVYLCPENSHQLLSHAMLIMPSNGIVVKHIYDRFQQLLILIHQTLENVIECWCLGMIEIENLEVVRSIENFLINRINNFQISDDKELNVSMTAIITYLARMFERGEFKQFPEYIVLGLDLTAETIPTFSLVHRPKRRCLNALTDCLSSRHGKIKANASWLIHNYLNQDIDHYSKLINWKLRDQPEIIIIDD